jgi:dehydrogenase/reductase SDR family member 1
MNSPNGKVALVTGASRGGFCVYATGRSIAQTHLGEGIVPVVCDSTDEEAIARVFERIRYERGRLDVLVNSAWGGYERMVEDGQFTWPAPFWKQPLWRWDAMVTVGVRGAFVASQHAVSWLPHGGG